MQILLHSSKTMRVPDHRRAPLGVPQLLTQAEELADELKKVNDDWEIELFDGGQPLYPLLMVIE